jgi:hypothetical protein
MLSGHQAAQGTSSATASTLSSPLSTRGPRQVRTYRTVRPSRRLRHGGPATSCADESDVYVHHRPKASTARRPAGPLLRAATCFPQRFSLALSSTLYAYVRVHVPHPIKGLRVMDGAHHV